jgi:nucleotide-binding universal stress UspA family protein
MATSIERREQGFRVVVNHRDSGSAKAALPVTAVVADGATVDAAVEGLDWEDGDLLMLGSSRLAPPRRLFIGSTAARILRVLERPDGRDSG